MHNDDVSRKVPLRTDRVDGEARGGPGGPHSLVSGLLAVVGRERGTDKLDSHCDTCKVLSGSTFTLNQIIPKAALNITKGESQLKSYTYYGESGRPPPPLSSAAVLIDLQARASTATSALTAPRTSTTTRRSWARTPSSCAPAC